MTTGIDASGHATVAWIDDAPLEHGRPGFVRVADAPAGGRFGPARDVTRIWDGHVVLAVTPPGRALLATDGPHSLRAYERLPGAAQFSRVHLPPVGSTDDLAAAMNPDGGAVNPYRNDERSVYAIVRAPGGAFRDGGTIVPSSRGSSGNAFAIFFSVDRLGPPYDGDGGHLSAALSPADAALLTWVDDARGADAAAAQVARRTLAGGFGRPDRIGSPCRSAASARPLSLADGTLGVAWSDDARARIVSGDTSARGAGSVHLALDRPAGAATPPAPGLSAHVTSPHALGPGEPLLVRVACRARCDVRVAATAHALPQPRWVNGGSHGGGNVQLGASTGLPAGGSTTLRLAPLSGTNAGGMDGAARTPIAVIACTPGGPVAQHVELAPPRARAPRPIPRVLGLTARRTGAGSAVRVTWRTSFPARTERFLVYGVAGGSQPIVHGRRSGRGQTRFAVTLRPRSGQRIRTVSLLMQAPEILIGAFFQAHVR